MTTLIAILAALLLALACGSERTNIKTLTDGVKLHNAGLTTIEALIRLPAPAWHNHGPRTSAETAIVTIEATVLRYHQETDQDLHLVLQGASGATMIAEIPSGACAAKSPWVAKMRSARARFPEVFRPGVKLRLTGAVFFDRLHGQDGVASNGIELHPVLKVEVVQ